MRESNIQELLRKEHRHLIQMDIAPFVRKLVRGKESESKVEEAIEKLGGEIVLEAKGIELTTTSLNIRQGTLEEMISEKGFVFYDVNSQIGAKALLDSKEKSTEHLVELPKNLTFDFDNYFSVTFRAQYYETPDEALEREKRIRDNKVHEQNMNLQSRGIKISRMALYVTIIATVGSFSESILSTFFSDTSSRYINAPNELVFDKKSSKFCLSKSLTKRRKIRLKEIYKGIYKDLKSCE